MITEESAKPLLKLIDTLRITIIYSNNSATQRILEQSDFKEIKIIKKNILILHGLRILYHQIIESYMNEENITISEICDNIKSKYIVALTNINAKSGDRLDDYKIGDLKRVFKMFNDIIEWYNKGEFDMTDHSLSQYAYGW